MLGVVIHNENNASYAGPYRRVPSLLRLCSPPSWIAVGADLHKKTKNGNWLSLSRQAIWYCETRMGRLDDGETRRTRHIGHPCMDLSECMRRRNDDVGMRGGGWRQQEIEKYRNGSRCPCFGAVGES